MVIQDLYLNDRLLYNVKLQGSATEGAEQTNIKNFLQPRNKTQMPNILYVRFDIFVLNAFVTEVYFAITL
jgi:hypothetical protein